MPSRACSRAAYTVTFSAPGMKKSESSVTLQNGQVLVFNRQLTVGEVTEKVTVTGETHSARHL